MTSTQIQREEQLDEIDAAMEDIIDDIECSEEDDEKMVIDIPNKDAIPPSIAEVLGEL